MGLINIPAEKQQLVTIVSVVVIVIALGFLMKTQCARIPRSAGGSANFNATVGMVAAEEAAKLVGKGKAVLITLDYGRTDFNPARDQLKGFERQARKSGLSIRATESAKSEMPMVLGPMAGLSVKQLLDLLTKYADADVMVIFTGTPPLPAAEVAKLPAKRPKVVSVSMMGGVDRGMLDADVVQVAIVPKIFAGPMAGGGGRKFRDARARFNEYFQVVTTATVIDLPRPPGM